MLYQLSYSRFDWNLAAAPPLSPAGHSVLLLDRIRLTACRHRLRQLVDQMWPISGAKTHRSWETIPFASSRRSPSLRWSVGSVVVTIEVATCGPEA
jgi:hypothetical protein